MEPKQLFDMMYANAGFHLATVRLANAMRHYKGISFSAEKPDMSIPPICPRRK
jgi:hypothetical protein